MNPPLFPRNAKVVCIDDNFHPVTKTLHRRLPVAGGVYTVSDSFYGRCRATGRKCPGLQVAETPPIESASSEGFLASRFRLLAEPDKTRAGRRRTRRKLCLIAQAIP